MFFDYAPYVSLTIFLSLVGVRCSLGTYDGHLGRVLPINLPIRQAIPNMLKSGFVGVFAAAAAALAPSQGGSGTSVIGLGLGLGFGILGAHPVDAWFWDSSSDDKDDKNKNDSKDNKDKDSWDLDGWWDSSDGKDKDKDDSKDFDVDIGFGSGDGERFSSTALRFLSRQLHPPSPLSSGQRQPTCRPSTKSCDNAMWLLQLDDCDGLPGFRQFIR